MIYRQFGKTGINVSALGFGAMRLPRIEGEKDIDFDLAVSLMRQAFDMGINYVDTAPLYCEKQSEIAVGKALSGRKSS